jgi:hypothetical protein
MVAYDVGAINGAYLEGRVRQALPIAKGASFVLSARAGRSIKQTADSVPEAFAAYQRDGFTHLDVTLGAALPVAGALVTPYLTYTYVPSPLVSATMPGRQERTTLVFGTSVVVVGYIIRACSKPSQPLMGVTLRCSDACFGCPQSSTRSSGARWLFRIWTISLAPMWCSPKCVQRPHWPS